MDFFDRLHSSTFTLRVVPKETSSSIQLKCIENGAI